MNQLVKLSIQLLSRTLINYLVPAKSIFKRKQAVGLLLQVRFADPRFISAKPALFYYEFNMCLKLDYVTSSYATIIISGVLSQG